MGDIADMHIEAIEAGLDPNEMDGADWLEFYFCSEDVGPVTPAYLIDQLGSWCSMLLSSIDDMRDLELDDQDTSVDARAEVLNLYIPAISKPTAAGLIELLVQVNDAANSEADRLNKQEGEDTTSGEEP